MIQTARIFSACGNTLRSNACHNVASAARVPRSISTFSEKCMNSKPYVPRREENLAPIDKRYFSSEGLGFFDKMKNKFEARAEKKKGEKMSESLIKMANVETFTLKAWASDMEEALSDWRMKIPGLSAVSQKEAMKEQKKVIDSLSAKLGSDARYEDVEAMSEKEKLKLCISCGVPLEDVEIILKQFQNMEIIHRVLRYRKVNGKSMPTDDESVKLAMQEDSDKIVTKAERKRLTAANRRNRGL